MATVSPIDSTSPAGSSLAMAAFSTDASTAPSLDTASPIIQFTTVERLFDEINQTAVDILTVYGVSAQQFTEIEKEREKRRRKIRFRRYLAQSKLLIITIPTALHEELHLGIWNAARDNIVQMRLQNGWRSMGSTTLRVIGGHPGGDGGEGDSTGGPRPQRSGVGAWPTLVIEAGHSESLQDLQRDMRWWFGASDHQVQIVLLCKFDRDTMTIILEKWVEVPAQIRQGATNTRAAAQLQPARQQDITITQNPDISYANRLNPTSYSVARGALRLEFNLVFLQQPGQGEDDIIISVQDLQEYAARVWEVVE